MNIKRMKISPKLKRLLDTSVGLTLIEVLVALAIMGLTAAFVGGVYTALTTSSVNTEFINAEALAKSQMESIMKQPYIMRVDYIDGDPDHSYSKIQLSPDLVAAGYGIVIFVPQDVPNSDENVQKIIIDVTVTKEGATKTIIRLVDYKLNNA
jgi:prepilin-type N-terminal cleavage/methylation domain-containing protein